MRHARKRSHPTHSPLALLAVSFGAICLAMIYFSILSPLNASWDSRWYHLPIAEQYASAGRVFRFGEGWALGTYPQLASLLYAWGFMLPKAQLFDRIVLCAHVEFSIFVWTVAAVPVLAKRALPAHLGTRLRLRGGWAAMFLFPGLFLYDSSLNLGADHIATCGSALSSRSSSLAKLACASAAFAVNHDLGVLLTKYLRRLTLHRRFRVICALWLLAAASRQAPSRGAALSRLVLGSR